MEAEHENRVHAYFESRAATWDDRYRHDDAIYRRIARFEDALHRRAIRGGAVLDLGCGSGRITRSLASRGFSMTGADVSKHMLDQAKSEPDGDRVRWVQQDHDRPFPLPLGDREFDAVISSSVLEYVSNPKEALEEMARLLKPGGRVFFTVPDPRHRKRVRERRQQALLRFAPVRSLLRLTPARNYALYLELSATRLPLDRWASLVRGSGLAVCPMGACEGPLAMIEAEKPATSAG